MGGHIHTLTTYVTAASTTTTIPGVHRDGFICVQVRKMVQHQSNRVYGRVCMSMNVAVIFNSPVTSPTH